MSESRLHLFSEELTYLEPTYLDITIEEHSKLIPPKPILVETYSYSPKLEDSLLAIYISIYGKKKNMSKNDR